MYVCGVDFDTRSIHAVTLALEGTSAEGRQLELDSKGDAFDRCRRVREVMPPRGWWLDEGVLGICLERPMGASRTATATLMRVQGAILACLPSELLVHELGPPEWKRRTVGKGNATKENVAEWVHARWAMAPDVQDALDAYAMAWAIREMLDTEVAA